MVETTETPSPTKPYNLFLISYRLWNRVSSNCAHATEVQWVTPQRESQKKWLAREKWGMSQREVAETLGKVLK